MTIEVVDSVLGGAQVEMKVSSLAIDPLTEMPVLILKDLAVYLVGGRLHSFTDKLLALLKIDNDIVFAKILPVSAEISDRELLRAHEAMPHRQVAAPDIAVGKLQHFKTEQGNNGVDRAGKGHRQRSPAHGFGKGDMGDEIGEHLFEQVPGGETLFFAGHA